MVQFILGAMFGGFVGAAVMCLCRAAGEADKRTEENKHNER